MELLTLKETLMQRDNLSAQEAEKLIQEAKDELRERLNKGEFPLDFCEEVFGLEPDYISYLF